MWCVTDGLVVEQLRAPAFWTSWSGAMVDAGRPARMTLRLSMTDVTQLLHGSRADFVLKLLQSPELVEANRSGLADASSSVHCPVRPRYRARRQHCRWPSHPTDQQRPQIGRDLCKANTRAYLGMFSLFLAEQGPTKSGPPQEGTIFLKPAENHLSMQSGDYIC